MSPFTAGRINRICYDQTDLERSAGFEPATQEVEAPCSVSTELRAHDGAPGWTRTHIFLSITFVSVRSGGGYRRINGLGIKGTQSPRDGPRGENSHSHS